MSSDLWKEFAATNEDVLDNPWAQTPSQPTLLYVNTQSPEPVNFVKNVAQGNRQDSGQWTDNKVSENVSDFHTGRIGLRSISEKDNIWGEEKSDGFKPPTQSSAIRLESSLARKTSDVLEVLFDAGEESEAEDDDFGDFEAPDVQDTQITHGSKNTRQSTFGKTVDNDLLGLDEATSSLAVGSNDQATDLTIHQDNSFSELISSSKPNGSDFNGGNKPKPTKTLPKNSASGKSPLRIRHVETSYADDEWGDFEDSPHPAGSTRFQEDEKPTTTSCKRPPLVTDLGPISSLNLEAKDNGLLQDGLVRAVERIESVPPSNIPPPSILLPLVVLLIQKLPGELREIAQQTSQFESSRRALTMKLGLCKSTSTTGARILAGRKLRWKRDTHLLQGMKIGPAHGGKVGGMKLVGIDKAESRREDREAAELVRVWKQHSGSLRAAIATANAHSVGRVVLIPEVTEAMAVRTAKASEGALKDSKSCVLCGLNRDERVFKVDVDVEDSFGEWWTEHWGHTDCRVFWEKHEQFLQQR
ncbi:hypothetical protein MMC06_002881 [Schaereria dolodes]|nr:hypothetical protein [Schaereria dolodes]